MAVVQLAGRWTGSRAQGHVTADTRHSAGKLTATCRQIHSLSKKEQHLLLLENVLIFQSRVDRRLASQPC